MAPAFEPPDLDCPILANGEEAIRDWDALALLRWKEDNVSVDGLDCQREARAFFNFLGELLEVIVGCAFLPNVKGIH